MQVSLPPPSVEAILLILVLAAAICDVRYRRIPNWITAGGVLAGLAVNIFLRGWSGLRFSLLGLGTAFGVYMVLHLLRAMGAGDVKLMAAIGALVGWENWFAIFLITAITGGIIALIAVIIRKRLKKTLFNVGYIFSEMSHGRAAYLTREELDVKNPKAMRLAHGAVIAVGSVFFLALSARWGQ